MNNNCSYSIDKQNNTIIISSSDNYSCKIISDIISQNFNDKSKVFYASGLPGNINEIYDDIKQYNPLYNKRDSQKFYIRKYPEICITIADDELLNLLLGEWTSAIYETRRIFIVAKSHEQQLLNDFCSCKDFQKYNILKSCFECIIENAPEAEDNNTFILKCNTVTFEKINLFINEGLYEFRSV